MMITGLMEKQKKNKKIPICSPNSDAYPETFIQAQIDLLPADLVLYGGWLPKRYNDNKIITSRLHQKLNRLSTLIFRKPVFSYNYELNKLLKKNKISTILAQFGPSGVALLPFCKKYNYELIVHFHGFDASVYEILESNKDKYLEMFFFAKKIITVSNKMKSTIIDLHCPINKIALIPYGPNDMFFENQPKYESNTFFSIGRFVDKKAPYLTLMAFYELQKEFPSAKLRMAGNGELLNTCKNMVKAWSIDDKVEFIGVIKPEQTKIEMENALAFVQHSVIADSGDSEGTPVAILEAQASSLPVISTFHAGIPDVVISEKTGFLVQEMDVMGMKEAMQRVLLDKELARMLGANGRERIKDNFTMEIYIAKVLDSINE